MRPALLGRLTAALAFLLCGVAPLHAQPAAVENAVMAVPNFSLTFSAGYIAEDLGLWDKEGLHVKSVSIAGIGSTNALISGSVDFAEISGSSFTRAAAHGQRLLAIADLIAPPFAQIVLRKDLATAAGFNPDAPLAERARVLRGRTLAVDSINSVVDAYLRAIAAVGGIDPESLRRTPMQPANVIAAFKTKAIDGFAMSLPWPQVPVQAGTAVVIASGPDGDPPNLQTIGQIIMATRPDVCAKHRSVCEKMGKGLVAAVAIIKDHPKEALGVLNKRFPDFDPALLAASFKELQKATPQPPVMTDKVLDEAETFSIAAGLLKPEQKLKSYAGLTTDVYVK